MRANQVIKRLLSDQKGATAVEYGLILALIVLAIMGAMSAVGNETGGMWDDVATAAATYM